MQQWARPRRKEWALMGCSIREAMSQWVVVWLVVVSSECWEWG